MTTKTDTVQRALQARKYLEGQTKSVRKYFLSFCQMYLVTMLVDIQSNLLSEYLEGHPKSVLLIRGTFYQYWLT